MPDPVDLSTTHIYRCPSHLYGITTPYRCPAPPTVPPLWDHHTHLQVPLPPIFADSLPVKYSPAAVHVIGIIFSLGARLTLQHWMYFSHHQHAQEAPCSVLVLAPKRSAVQRGVVQEFVGARTSSPAGVYMLVSDETSSAIQCNCKVRLYFTHKTTIPLTKTLTL